MKVTTSGTNLFQLTHFFGLINCYLVREDDGFTLIDTALRSQAHAIIQEAHKLSLLIVRLLLTHAHIDHVGSLDILHEALPHAQIAISERDARFLSGDRSLDASEPQVPLHGRYPICKTKPTRLLHEGDRLGSLEVIASPGHTPGHLAFLDTRDRTLIAGDAFQTLGRVAAVAGSFQGWPPLASMGTWHKGLALESARKLLMLHPSLLAVGHGQMLSNPQMAMEHAISVMEQSFTRQVRIPNFEAKKQSFDPGIETNHKE